MFVRNFAARIAPRPRKEASSFGGAFELRSITTHVTLMPARYSVEIPADCSQIEQSKIYNSDQMIYHPRGAFDGIRNTKDVSSGEDAAWRVPPWARATSDAM
jgi:hypothetical protein